MNADRNTQFFENLEQMSGAINERYPEVHRTSISVMPGESFMLFRRGPDSMRVRVISYDDKSGYQSAFNFLVSESGIVATPLMRLEAIEASHRLFAAAVQSESLSLLVEPV